MSFVYPGTPFSLSARDLVIPADQRVAVVGPSGSGKTTLVNLMAGILVPTSGTVELDGRAISAMNDRDRRATRLACIGLVFQRVELIDYLSVRENVLVPARISHALRLDASMREWADRLLDRVGLLKLADRRASELSQGERQRVGICRALIASPGVLLADEPTSALDGQTADEVVSLLMEVSREASATLVMLTHDRSLLDRFDGVIAVSGGIASWQREPMGATQPEASS